MAKLKKPLAKAARKTVASKAGRKKVKTRKSASRAVAESGDDLPPMDDAEYEAAIMDTEKLALEVARAEEEPGEIDEDADAKLEPLPLPVAAQVDQSDDSSEAVLPSMGL